MIDLAAERAARGAVQAGAMSAWIEGSEVVVQFPGGQRQRLTPHHLRIWRDNFAALLGNIEAAERGRK